jgi:hypothetical protein
MRTGLWVVIVVVTGIVGYLVGYSVSAYTGVKKPGPAHAAEMPAAGKPVAPAAATGGYGAAPATPAAAGGYGAQPAAKPAAKPPAAGY